MTHRWRKTVSGARECVRCRLKVYAKRRELWARWPEGTTRQIGWIHSRRRLVKLGPCPRPDFELTRPAPKPRGGDQWRGRSKSARAVLLVDQGHTITQAARSVGVSPQAVSLAVKRQRLKHQRDRQRRSRLRQKGAST